MHACVSLCSSSCMCACEQSTCHQHAQDVICLCTCNACITFRKVSNANLWYMLSSLHLSMMCNMHGLRALAEPVAFVTCRFLAVLSLSQHPHEEPSHLAQGCWGVHIMCNISGCVCMLLRNTLHVWFVWLSASKAYVWQQCWEAHALTLHGVSGILFLDTWWDVVVDMLQMRQPLWGQWQLACGNPAWCM